MQCGTMAHTQTGVFEAEAEETVKGLLQQYDVPREIAEEADSLLERGEPIEALDILVRNR